MSTKAKGVSLAEMMDRLPADERAAIEARTKVLIAEEMTLRALRKALGRTQVALAERLGIKQENVARIEQRSDMLLSTLDGYLRKLGGRLRLVAEFEGRPSVTLTGLATVREGMETPSPPKRPRQAPKPAATPEAAKRRRSPADAPVETRDHRPGE